MIALRKLILPSLCIIAAGCGNSEKSLVGPPSEATLRLLSTATVLADIDIKPGECPNRLNPKSKGMLTVAILGTASFDVLDIDVSSIVLAPFEGVAPVMSVVEDVSTPDNGPDWCDCSDEGPDGFNDLVLKYRTQDIVAAAGQINTGHERRVILVGDLLDGTRFGGFDCLIGVGNPQDPAYNYEIKFDDQDHSSVWFGGDDRDVFGPRNVGVGQSVLVERDIVLHAFAFNFSSHFHLNSVPEVGHDVTLVLDVRNESGTVIKSLSRFVPASFVTGWVQWEGIDLLVDESTVLIFTAHVLGGFVSDLSSGVRGDGYGGYANGSMYTAVDDTGSGLSDWAEWSEHHWDAHFWLKGTRRSEGALPLDAARGL